MSNFPLSHLPLSHQFSAGTWLQSLHVPPFHLLACIWSQYLNSPRPLPAFIFGSQNSPCVSQQSFACIFMSLYFVSMSRLHPSSLNNYLRSPCFSIEISLSPICFIRRLPPLAPPPLLTFSLFQYRNFPGMSNFLSQYLNYPHPVLGPKNKRVPKKKAPRSKTSSPAPTTMELPPHPMEARSTKQVHGSKKQKPSSETINLAVEKKFPGSSTNTCRSKKNMPTGSRKHTSKSPTFFVTLGPKKNLVRSKKHVQVPKKGAQVQKTCIPITLGTCQPIRLNLNSA